jgi:hypothetical protein
MPRRDHPAATRPRLHQFNPAGYINVPIIRQLHIQDTGSTLAKQKNEKEKKKLKKG